MTITDLPAIQALCFADSQAWFPEVHRSDHDALVHFALGIAGEVGELVNLIKKVNRGSAHLTDVIVPMAHEMADVLIYLCDIASVCGIDLVAAVADKRQILVERWGDPEVTE